MQILCGETTMLATRTQKRRDGQPQSHGEERFPYLDSLRASVALWQCISVPPCLCGQRLRASFSEVEVHADLEEPRLQNVGRPQPGAGRCRRERAGHRERPVAVEHVIEVTVDPEADFVDLDPL